MSTKLSLCKLPTLAVCTALVSRSVGQFAAGKETTTHTLLFYASPDGFTRSVVPPTKYRRFSWCSLQVRIGLVFDGECIFLVDARMWDLVLRFYSKFGVWVMLKMWAWEWLDPWCNIEAGVRLSFQSLMHLLHTWHVYNQFLQEIHGNEASRGVSLHREGRRNACTWGWMVGVWIWIKKSLHGRNYMLLWSSNLTKWWRANTRLRWWPNRREEFTALSY